MKIKFTIIICLCLAIFFVGVTKKSAPESFWGLQLSGIYKCDLLDLHNEYRAQNKLQNFHMDIDLDRAAQSHADWMAAHNDLNHYEKTPDRKNVGDRVKSPWHMVGENIAEGQETSTEVVRAWMNSSGHRANILNNRFEKIGFGVKSTDHGIYWCAVFTD